MYNILEKDMIKIEIVPFVPIGKRGFPPRVLSGAWKDSWIKFLDRHRSEPDFSGVDLDGSHIPAMRGGDAVEYHGRKKRKTTTPYI